MSRELTVLHVDDDPAVLDMSRQWADTREGLTCLTAADPVSGIETLAEEDVDCLVSDSIPFDDDGAFVTRAAATAPETPIVLFTAATHDAVDADIRQTASEYVKKGSPDQFATLFEHVSALAADESRSTATAVDAAAQIAPRPGMRSETGESTPSWKPIGRYDPAGESALTTTIVSAVEEYTGRDAESLPPLYDSIDAERLAALFQHPDGTSRSGIQVRFYYADHELAVTSGGLVLVRSAD
ncbi:MAG: HalOD1 output domain-containing protein [Haloplanus sp.]